MKNFVSRVIERHVYLLTAIVLSILSFGFRYHALNQTSYANGWDTYFYLVQLSSLIEEGQMHSEEWTLLYPLLIVFHYVAPDDITAVKLLAAFLAACFTLVVCLNGKAMKLNLAWIVLIGMIALWSPELTYFTAQWPKNLLGMVMLLLLLLCIQRDNKKWIFVVLVAGFFCHRMTAVLGVLVFFIWIIFKHLPAKILITFLLVILITALTASFFPGVLNLHDIERLKGFIDPEIQFPILSFYTLFGKSKISLMWQAELILVLLLFTILCLRLVYDYFSLRKDNLIAYLVSAVFIILWFPFYHWDLTGIAYRFFHAGALLLPMLVMCLATNIKVSFKVPNVISCFFIVCSLYSWKAYSPEVHDPPYALYEQLTMNTIKSWNEKLKPELVIAHKALAEFFTYTSYVDAMPWVPEYKIEIDRLWRIAAIPYPKLFQYHLSTETYPLGANYFYVREDDWQLFLTKLKTNESDDLFREFTDWKNPSEMRPRFLKK